jgi:hypothetical protein
MTYYVRTKHAASNAPADAELWSDDTYTLHFGRGFEEECESSPATLAEAVALESLLYLAALAFSSAEREKAADACHVIHSTRAKGAKQCAKK